MDMEHVENATFFHTKHLTAVYIVSRILLCREYGIPAPEIYVKITLIPAIYGNDPEEDLFRRIDNLNKG